MLWLKSHHLRRVRNGTFCIRIQLHTGPLHFFKALIGYYWEKDKFFMFLSLCVSASLCFSISQSFSRVPLTLHCSLGTDNSSLWKTPFIDVKRLFKSFLVTLSIHTLLFLPSVLLAHSMSCLSKPWPLLIYLGHVLEIGRISWVCYLSGWNNVKL